MENAGWPLITGTFRPKVVIVKRWFHEHYGGQAASHMGNFFNFFQGKGAAQDGLFPVGEPLFDYLVAD